MVSHTQCCSTASWTSVLVYGFWNARFMLQLNTIHFKFTLWAISILDEKDVHLLRSSSMLQEFHLLGYEVWLKLTNVLEEATSSVCTIKTEEPTTSNFMVEKEGMINFYQSAWCHNQDDSSL
jgi:hypothetical protein